MVKACAVLHNVVQLMNVALPFDAVGCFGPDPDPDPHTFEPNATATGQHVDVMRYL